MLTAYDNYKLAHASLFDATTKEDVEQSSQQTVEQYLENRLIWKELTHYKETGVILGDHPIFDWLVRRDQIRGMRIADLVNLRIRLDNNLVRNRAALRREPAGGQTAKRKERIARMEMEMLEVNRLLNL